MDTQAPLILSGDVEAYKATMGNFTGLFDDLDLAHEVSGFLSAEAIHNYHVANHCCSLSLRQVKEAVRTLCADPESGVSEDEFEKVLFDVVQRCIKSEELYWDYQGLKQTDESFLERQCRFMFEIHRGKSYSEAEVDEFLASRPFPDTSIAFEEFELILTKPRVN